MCINQSLPDEPEFNKGLTIRKHWGGLKYSVNDYGVGYCNLYEPDYFIFDSFDKELLCSSNKKLRMSLDMISGKMTINDSSDNYEEKYICKNIARLIQ